MLSFFPRGVLDEILNLIESVSEGFPSYSFKWSNKSIGTAAVCPTLMHCPSLVEIVRTSHVHLACTHTHYIYAAPHSGGSK